MDEFIPSLPPAPRESRPRRALLSTLILAAANAGYNVVAPIAHRTCNVQRVTRSRGQGRYRRPCTITFRYADKPRVNIYQSNVTQWYIMPAQREVLARTVAMPDIKSIVS